MEQREDEAVDIDLDDIGEDDFEVALVNLMTDRGVVRSMIDVAICRAPTREREPSPVMLARERAIAAHSKTMETKR